MKIKFKIWVTTLIVSLFMSLGVLGKIAYTNWQLNNTRDQLNKQLMQANLELGRAKTEFGNAQKYIKSLEEKVQEEIKARDAVLTRIGWFRGQLQTAKKIIKATKNDQEIIYVDREILIESPIPMPDFERGMLYQATGPKSLMVLGEINQKFQDYRMRIHVIIKPISNKEMVIPVEVGYMLGMHFRGEIAETLLPSGGRNLYLNIWETNEGKDINKIKLDKFKVIIDDQRKPRFMWAPHLDIGLTSHWESVAREFRTGGSFGLSAFGFGVTKNDLSWRFLRLSLEIQESIGFGFSPVLVNLGNRLIPLISNMWTGPNVIWFLPNRWVAGLFLGGVI